MSFLKKWSSKDSTSTRSSASSTRTSSWDSKAGPSYGYGETSSTSGRNASVSSTATDGSPLSTRQRQAARRQLEERPIDDATSLASRKTRGSTSTSSSSKKSARRKWFDVSSLATPIATHEVDDSIDPDDPNVYWDEEAGVWRYWYYTWSPMF